MNQGGKASSWGSRPGKPRKESDTIKGKGSILFPVGFLLSNFRVSNTPLSKARYYPQPSIIMILIIILALALTSTITSSPLLPIVCYSPLHGYLEHPGSCPLRQCKVPHPPGNTPEGLIYSWCRIILFFFPFFFVHLFLCVSLFIMTIQRRKKLNRNAWNGLIEGAAIQHELQLRITSKHTWITQEL